MTEVVEALHADPIELASPHPHPVEGMRFGFPWSTSGSQPFDASWFTADYAAMWKAQPSLRKVVSFLASNIAQLPIHTFRRVSTIDRERVTAEPYARIVSRPSPDMSRYRLIEALVSDLCLFDRAYSIVADDGAPSWRWIPAHWADWDHDDDELVLSVWMDEGTVRLPAEKIVWLAGYNPNPPDAVPPCETLRQILAEEASAMGYRAQLWRNGARMSGWIERPDGAPDWSDPARERFRREWHGRWTGDSYEAGGTPVLEEGMKWHAATMTAEQAQYVEARKLTTVEVATAYGVPPPMVGVLDNANFSNTREMRKSLYQDTLGPWVQMLTEEIERQMLWRWPNTDEIYYEFQVKQKLSGSFEEQADVLSRSVGAPWMTRNEARALNNLHSIEDADALIVPLNVIEGGQPSPATPINALAATPRRKGDARAEAKARLDSELSLRQRLATAFTAQQRIVIAALAGGANLPGAFDLDLWNSRFASLLEGYGWDFAMLGVNGVLTAEEARLFSPNRMANWLTQNSQRAASAINFSTYQQIAEVVLGPDWREKLDHIYELARTSRAEEAATTYGTTTQNFGARDAARFGQRTAKTWHTTSRNPRPTHAALSGQTVPLDQPFGNGAYYPGDPSLPAEERSRCQCVVEYHRGE